MTARLVLPAPVPGFAAVVLARMLAELMPAKVAQLQRDVERGKLDPGYLREVLTAWRALRQVERDWLESMSASADADAGSADIVPGSPEIDTKAAAAALGITERQVRRRLAAGRLAGRQIRPGGPWRVDRTEVHAGG